MRQINNFDQVQESTGEFLRLLAGGYVCKIVSVEDVSEKEYLKIKYDICEGEFKNYWADTEKRAKFWGGEFIRSYKETALPMFKGFIASVERTNPNYKWNWNEATLIGKGIGLVLGEEDYTANDGTIKTRLRVAYNTEVNKIRQGDYKVPEKKISTNNTSSFNASIDFEPVPISDDDLPF